MEPLKPIPRDSVFHVLPWVGSFIPKGNVSLKGHPASFPFPGIKGPKLRYPNLNGVCQEILPQEKSYTKENQHQLTSCSQA